MFGIWVSNSTFLVVLKSFLSFFFLQFFFFFLSLSLLLFLSQPHDLLPPRVFSLQPLAKSTDQLVEEFEGFFRILERPDEILDHLENLMHQFKRIRVALPDYFEHNIGSLRVELRLDRILLFRSRSNQRVKNDVIELVIDRQRDVSSPEFGSIDEHDEQIARLELVEFVHLHQAADVADEHLRRGLLRQIGKQRDVKKDVVSVERMTT